MLGRCLEQSYYSNDAPGSSQYGKTLPVRRFASNHDLLRPIPVVPVVFCTSLLPTQ